MKKGTIRSQDHVDARPRVKRVKLRTVPTTLCPLVGTQIRKLRNYFVRTNIPVLFLASSSNRSDEVLNSGFRKWDHRVPQATPHRGNERAQTNVTVTSSQKPVQ